MTDGTTSSGTGGFPSPYLAVIGAGGGKTNLIRLLVAQQARHRWPVWLIDLGRQHRWARDLPSVAWWPTIGAAEEGLIGLGIELTARSAGVSATPERHELLVIDDIDVVLPQLEERWRQQRRPGDPEMGPAVSAWADAWLHGRARGIHAVVTAGQPDQRFWADVAGTRIIGAGASQATWDAIAPGTQRPTPDSPHPGRVHTIEAAGTVTEVQVVLITDDEAHGLATGAGPVDRSTAG